MENNLSPVVGQIALPLLLALAVLIYGTLHGALIVWVWRNREPLIIPTFSSIVLGKTWKHVEANHD